MMSNAPLAGLSFDVALHLIAALLALGLGPLAIYRQRRDVWHKLTGYAWVSAMFVLAASSFWIDAVILPLVAGFGPIHLLSAWVVVLLFGGLKSARQGQIRRHQAQMRGLYWTGLMVAGLFTLLPGRVLNQAIFPGLPEAGYGAIVGLGALLIWVILRDRRLFRPN